MKGVFSLETLRAMQREMADNAPGIAPCPLRPERASFMGMPVSQSAAFPFESECTQCGGSGEGSGSTYCDRCDGQGRTRYEGAMFNGQQTTLFTSPLPKAFSPSFPRGLVPAPRLSRGLP